MEKEWVSEEQFAADMKPFVDEGLLTELWYDAGLNATVYNMCDTVYVAVMRRLAKGSIFGYAMTGAVAKRIYRDRMAFVKYLQSLTAEELLANMVMFNPLTLDAVRKYKQKTDQTGPTESIDKKFEARIRTEKMINKQNRKNQRFLEKQQGGKKRV